jgi:orotidine-5'-phosphate decarboxylase
MNDHGSAKDSLCCALDVPERAAALALAEQVKDHVGVLKVGLELFMREGPAVVEPLLDLGCRVFLDLKLHDIPETVGRAVRNAERLGVHFLTLHAQGGQRMLQAARDAVAGTQLRLLAVTVLTSMQAEDLGQVGLTEAPAAQVARLAKLADTAGISGLVCSIEEVPALRKQLAQRAFLVVPGIRPAGSDAFDQRRVGTPSEALRQGANLLVVGRPIRDAASPRRAAAAIEAELDACLRQPSATP